MDGYQFTANVIASIASVLSASAWPAVLALLLLLVKPQLRPLAQRLSELTLPGGAKASFRTDLEIAKSQAITLVGKSDASSASAGSLSVGGDLTPDSPKDFILEKFHNLQNFIQSQISELPIDKRRTSSDFVYYEIEQVLGRQIVYDLYMKLQRMYLTVSEAKSDSLTKSDAVQYEEICVIFEKEFADAFIDWKKKYFDGRG